MDFAGGGRTDSCEFTHLSLTDDPQEDEWTSMHTSNENGDPLSPAAAPDDDNNRMSKSLDLGYDELQDDVTNFSSFPWQTKSRTLDSPQKTRGASPASGQSSSQRNKSSAGSDGDKFKYKLMSAWNNMKFGMKPKTQFRVDAPIWMLGCCYHCSKREQEELQNSYSMGVKPLNMAFENFKRDFVSKIWFTYRKDFPVLCGSQFTTDVGWGCMLRTGQMILAQALVLHFLGRDWRWHSHQKKYELVFHHQIIKFFGDLPDEDCPFSIHHLVKIGAESGKKPGDWYGPASVAHVLREAVERAPKSNALLSQIRLYVAQDCTIYKQDVIDLCTRPNHLRPDSARSSTGSASSFSHNQPHPAEDPWHPVVILIPVRLGGEALNPIYSPCVRSILEHDLGLGIIGGRPKHSLYFIGWQEDKLINLDPHLCQDSVDVMERNFPLQTYHCMSPRKMSFSKMDPSCTLGFYCRTRNDFIRFVRESEYMASPPKEKGLYPMYVFQEGRSKDLMNDQAELSNSEERYLRIRRLDKKGRPKGRVKESEDFVFL